MPFILLAPYLRYVYCNKISADQCHIGVRICHRAVALTSDVTYICTIGLRGLNAVWNAGIPVMKLRIGQEAFLNSSPSKFSLATNVFPHFDDQFEKKM